MITVFGRIEQLDRSNSSDRGIVVVATGQDAATVAVQEARRAPRHTRCANTSNSNSKFSSRSERDNNACVASCCRQQGLSQQQQTHKPVGHFHTTICDAKL